MNAFLRRCRLLATLHYNSTPSAIHCHLGVHHMARMLHPKFRMCPSLLLSCMCTLLTKNRALHVGLTRSNRPKQHHTSSFQPATSMRRPIACGAVRLPLLSPCIAPQRAHFSEDLDERTIFSVFFSPKSDRYDSCWVVQARIHGSREAIASTTVPGSDRWKSASTCTRKLRDSGRVVSSPGAARRLCGVESWDWTA